MSKKLHNFDLKGLQWSTLGRPRGSGHSNDEASSADASMFVFKAQRDVGTARSKLDESLSIPRGKAVERRLQKGKQVKNGEPPYTGDDVVEGAHLLTKQIELKKPVSEKDSDSATLTKVSGKAEMTGGSGSCEGAKRWNLRGRKRTGFSKGDGSLSPVEGSSARGPYKGRENGRSRGKMKMLLLPGFSFSLTKEEALEDVRKMSGMPPPKKFKKRNIDLLFPGSYLGNITLHRYEVKEKLPTWKGGK